jgi:hypothetical protein
VKGTPALGILGLKVFHPLHLIGFKAAELLPPAPIRDLVTPIARTASATDLRKDTRTSTCRSFAAISLGL